MDITLNFIWHWFMVYLISLYKSSRRFPHIALYINLKAFTNLFLISVGNSNWVTLSKYARTRAHTRTHTRPHRKTYAHFDHLNISMSASSFQVPIIFSLTDFLLFYNCLCIDSIAIKKTKRKKLKFCCQFHKNSITHV